MDKMYNHESSDVMKLAKKLGIHKEFMKYCEDKGEEVTSENEQKLFKDFVKEQGYTKEDLKKMMAESEMEDSDESSDMESEYSDEYEDEKPKKGMSIAIVIGKGGKIPPAWS